MGTTIMTAALAMVPVGQSEDRRLVFIEQTAGPYRGALLCPGGKIERGEDAESAARRETAEEAGYQVERLSLTGVYELIGPDHHIVMFAFRAAVGAVRIGPGEHGVVEAPAAAVAPHATVRRILSDSGLADYDTAAIEADLRRDGILMHAHLTSSAPAYP